MGKDNSWMSYMNKQQPQQTSKRGNKNASKGNTKGNVASSKQMNRHTQ